LRRAGLAFGALLFLQFSGCHKQVVKSFPLPSDTMTSQSATPAPDSVAAAAPATPLPATPAAPGVPLDTAAIVTAPVAEAAPLNCRVPRNTVRVILLQSRSPVAVSLTGAFLWYYNAEKGGNVSGAAHAEYRSGTLSFSGRKVRLSEGRAAACVPLDAASRFTVNGNNYRGGLVFRAAKSGALSIINDVAVEDYLRGVLPYEIGVRDSNLFEALKVQAVVARTYTYARLNSHADEGYDMFADQSDQVYNGVKGEYRLSDRAVSETRDEVVTCNDSLIQAFYFSTSSGNTANIEEVWPDRGFRPYLRSVPDAAFNAGAKYESWTERWPGPALSAIVNQGLREAIADFQKGVVTDIAVQDTLSAACLSRFPAKPTR